MRLLSTADLPAPCTETEQIGTSQIGWRQQRGVSSSRGGALTTLPSATALRKVDGRREAVSSDGSSSARREAACRMDSESWTSSSMASMAAADDMAAGISRTVWEISGVVRLGIGEVRCGCAEIGGGLVESATRAGGYNLRAETGSRCLTAFQVTGPATHRRGAVRRGARASFVRARRVWACGSDLARRADQPMSW